MRPSENRFLYVHQDGRELAEQIKRSKKIQRSIMQHRRNLAFEWAGSHSEPEPPDGFVKR
jgi:hypothetical protein